jgi:vacuolar-type H+-ATPase subunit I/STV1
MPTIYQTVEVEIDVSDLDEDEIVDACREMGYSVMKVNEATEADSLKEELNNLADLYRSKSDGLIEELRTVLQKYTGRILP